MRMGSEDLIKNTVMKHIRRYKKVESQMKSLKSGMVKSSREIMNK